MNTRFIDTRYSEISGSRRVRRFTPEALGDLLDLLSNLGIYKATDVHMDWESTDSKLGGSPGHGYIDPFIKRMRELDERKQKAKA